MGQLFKILEHPFPQIKMDVTVSLLQSNIHQMPRTKEVLTSTQLAQYCALAQNEEQKRDLTQKRCAFIGDRDVQKF